MADYLTTDTELTSVADAIRAKGGTGAALEWPQGYVDAVGAISGGMTPRTVTVSLDTPRHTGEASHPACYLFESEDGMSLVQVGTIGSPTGSTTVTVSKPLLLAVFHGAGTPDAGSISFPFDGVQPLRTDFLETSTNGVYVYNDGYFTISGVDYDD